MRSNLVALAVILPIIASAFAFVGLRRVREDQRVTQHCVDWRWRDERDKHDPLHRFMTGPGTSSRPVITRGWANDVFLDARSVTFFNADFGLRAPGCTIEARDESGTKVLWSKRLEGLGSNEASGWPNRMQLEVVNDVLVVRSWESRGRYVECLDVASGERLYRRELDPP